MREISVACITDAVAELAIRACCHLPEALRERFKIAAQEETSPLGREILAQLLENAAIEAVYPVSDGKHSRLRLRQGSTSLYAVLFGQSPK
ncbi:MAG: fumarate hydratase, partial [Bilophila sp.]